MTLAEKLVNAMLEGWVRDAIDGFKEFTGIGHDSFGLGKNTEKGWKPKYGRSNLGTSKTPPIRRQRPAPPGEGEKTWEVG